MIFDWQYAQGLSVDSRVATRVSAERGSGGIFQTGTRVPVTSNNTERMQEFRVIIESRAVSRNTESDTDLVKNGDV